MKTTIATLVTLLSIAAVAAEGDNAFHFGGGWRLSVGPALNAHIRTHVSANSSLLNYVPSHPTPAGASKAEAEAKANGSLDPDGVWRFDNGGWINPDDSAGVHGRTWNYNVPDAATLIEGGSMHIRNAWTETSFSGGAVAGGDHNRDIDYAPGVSFELARCLYEDVENKWGVDLALGFSWFMRRNLIRASGMLYNGTYTTESGYYDTGIDVSNLGDDIDGYPLNADGSLGRGTWNGPGPVIDTSTATTKNVVESSSSSTVGLGYRTRGNYNEFEFTLAARPWYDVTDWLRAYGTLGVGLSYMRLSHHTSLSLNGSTVRSFDSVENDWAVYMVAGLGAVAHYDRYSLGFDFFARPFARDMDFRNEAISGSVGRGDWMFRVMLGVDF